jgi:hypothetical protein
VIVLTERDKKIIKFLEFCPATIFILTDLFFPSVSFARKRLKLLTDYELVKRTRDYSSQSYVYFTGKKPVHIEHGLMLARLYTYLTKKGIEVLEVKREVLLDKGIRCDGLMILRFPTGEVKTCIVEIELNSNPIKNKLDKYEVFLKSSKCLELLACKPFLLFVTNKTVPPTDLEVMVLKTKVLETGEEKELREQEKAYRDSWKQQRKTLKS